MKDEEVFPHCKKHRIKTHSKDWFDFRNTMGVGGSEIATLLGLSEFQSAAEMFAVKVGLQDSKKFDNPATFWGRELEDHVVDAWKYYDGTDEGYVDNKNAGKVIRDYIDADYYLVSPDVPNSFVSLDFASAPGSVNMISGEVEPNPFPIECKTISGLYSKIYKSGIPEKYVAQVHLQMMHTNTHYAEIPFLIDGREFRVMKFERDEAMCNRITEAIHDFWVLRVEPAREAFKIYNQAQEEGDQETADKAMGIIQSLEPDPDSTKAYAQFYSDKFQKEIDEADGDEELLKLCMQHDLLHSVEKRMAAARQLVKNQITKVIVNRATEKLTFGKDGYCRYYKRANGNNFQLDVRLKDKPDDDIVKKEANKINIDAWI
jgi:hypothetical protein